MQLWSKLPVGAKHCLWSICPFVRTFLLSSDSLTGSGVTQCVCRVFLDLHHLEILSRVTLMTGTIPGRHVTLGCKSSDRNVESLLTISWITMCCATSHSIGCRPTADGVQLWSALNRRNANKLYCCMPPTTRRISIIRAGTRSTFFVPPRCLSTSPLLLSTTCLSLIHFTPRKYHLY